MIKAANAANTAPMKVHNENSYNIISIMNAISNPELANYTTQTP
jgi:hypothetical protein